MAGLSFLAKKSWHTSNLSNQEKVWLAEQKAQAEAQKVKELQNQIQLEREKEEFEKLAGKKITGDRGVDWMYEEGGGANNNVEQQHEVEEEKNEAYLLGKEYIPQGQEKHTGDFAVAAAMGGVLEKASTRGAVIGVGTIAPTENVTTLRIQEVDVAPSVENDLGRSEFNREFHLRHEDPMFAVHQKRQRQIKEAEKKKNLMEKAGLVVKQVARGHRDEPFEHTDGAVDGEIYRKEKKDRSRKRKKHHKHHRNRRDRSVSRSRSSSSSRDRHHRRKKDQRSRHRGRHERHRSDRTLDVSGSGSEEGRARLPDVKGSTNSRRDQYSNRGDDRRTRHHYDKHYKETIDSLDGRRSRERQDVHRDVIDRRDKDRSDPYRRDHDRSSEKLRSSSPATNQRRGRSTDSPSREIVKREGYGLIGTSLSGIGSERFIKNNNKPSSLGPDESLLAAKREEIEKERQSRFDEARRQEVNKKRSRQDIDRALEEMERNALDRDHMRFQERPREDDADDHNTFNKDTKAFASGVSALAYRIDGGKDAMSSMADRVSRNRHKNQKIDSDFL